MPNTVLYTVRLYLSNKYVNEKVRKISSNYSDSIVFPFLSTKNDATLLLVCWEIFNFCVWPCYQIWAYNLYPQNANSATCYPEANWNSKLTEKKKKPEKRALVNVIIGKKDNEIQWPPPAHHTSPKVKVKFMHI